MVALIKSRLIEQSNIVYIGQLPHPKRKCTHSHTKMYSYFYNTNQYTHRTVDIIYGAFVENESTKDCHVPSKDSNRAKEMPTYTI